MSDTRWIVVAVAIGGALALATLAVRLYGDARFDAGVAHQAAAHAQAAVALNQLLRDQKITADKRVAALNATLRQTEEKFHAEIARLTQTDDTFAAWLALRVHPSDVELVNRLRQQAGGGADGLPAGPGLDPAAHPP